MRSGKRTHLPLRVVCFVAVSVLTESADLSDAISAEFTGIRTREEDETGDEIAGSSEIVDWAVSIAAAMKRSTGTVSPLPAKEHMEPRLKEKAEEGYVVGDLRKLRLLAVD